MAATKAIQTKQGKVTVHVYYHESTARLMCGDKEWIMMGDCDGDVAEYWTCKPRDAARLHGVGYEYL